MRALFRGLTPVCRKEFLHIIRDPGTLFFALLIPMLQLILYGFAVDTNVRQIPTEVLDESHPGEPTAAGGVCGIRCFQVDRVCGVAGSAVRGGARGKRECRHTHSL